MLVGKKELNSPSVICLQGLEVFVMLETLFRIVHTRGRQSWIFGCDVPSGNPM